MHVEIERICVPTDFSGPASHAIWYGATLADQMKAELHLLHVLEDVHNLVLHPDFTADGDAALAYLLQLEEKAATSQEYDSEEDKKLHDFLRTLEKRVVERFDTLAAEDDVWQRLKVVHAVRYGHPVDQICRYAQKMRIDLLVLGSHGRTGVSHFLVGSVAERVVRASPCPVLVTREQQRAFVTYD
jgi:universal stress protein A